MAGLFLIHVYWHWIFSYITRGIWITPSVLYKIFEYYTSSHCKQENDVYENA